MTEERHDATTPAQQIISQYGDDIKAAIAKIADETPTIAKTAATAEASKRALWSLVVNWFSSVIVAAGVAWLIVTYVPTRHANQFTVHRGDAVEVCTRSEGAPADHPVFVCTPVPAGQ